MAPNDAGQLHWHILQEAALDGLADGSPGETPEALAPPAVATGTTPLLPAAGTLAEADVIPVEIVASGFWATMMAAEEAAFTTALFAGPTTGTTALSGGPITGTTALFGGVAPTAADS